MAKRELSTTLKSLKFMQRGVKKKEKPKVEQVVQPDGNFVSHTSQIKKCIVIMEGNRFPGAMKGAMKGRMSFQSFNPSIDKLNEAATNPCQPEFSATITTARKSSERENGFSSLGLDSLSLSPGSDSDGDLKRKKPEDVTETQYPNKSPKNASEEVDPHSSKNRNRSRKNQKREKLDWNVLRPPKVQNRECYL